jgi:hypothetical protein
MTIHTDDPEIIAHDPDATGPEVASGSGSVLDRVKKRRSFVKDTQEFAIPSWNGELLATMKVLDRDKIDDMIRHVQSRARQAQLTGKGRDRREMARIGNETDMDFLIDACTGIIARDEETEEEERVAFGFDDMSFAAQLDPRDEAGNVVEINTGRELLMYLLKWNTISLTTLSQKIARWMQDTSRPVEDPQ